MQDLRNYQTKSPRREAALKVTGAALYTGEIRMPGLVHAALVKSAIASGRAERIDTSEAERVPGCLAVYTSRNFLRLQPCRVLLDPGEDGQMNAGGAGQQHLPLQDDRIWYRGQDLAVVVAETAEQAREAAELVRVEYRSDRHETDFLRHLSERVSPGKVWTEDADVSRGNVEAGLEDSARAVDRVYVTATQHHVTMEPHSTLAVWTGPRLTVYEASTWVEGVEKTLAAWFGIDEQQVRVLQPFVGGSFGSKGPTWPHAALAAGAAKLLDRPVRLVLSRPQTFTSNGHRPSIRHRIRLGARAEGTLTAVGHEAVAQTSRFDTRVVAPVTKTTKKLYACSNCAVTYRLVQQNVPGPFTMRGPGETPGLFALETAMDELAYELHMDPVELRIKNDAQCDPESGKPWSSRGLQRCLRAGAERFGWSQRDPQVRNRLRHGRLYGSGMASMAYDAKVASAEARARLYRDGSLAVASSTSEPGTGATSVMVQIAAEEMGFAPERVRFEWGDTDLPRAPLAAGSQTTATVGSAVQLACRELKKQAAADTGPSRTEFIEARAKAEPTEAHRSHVCYSFGAHFVEVSADVDLGSVRIERYVAAFAAGRIVNPVMAQSQLYGGIIWGIGMALTEGTKLDPVTGAFVNDNLAEYLIPTHADIPPIDAFFLPEEDSIVNPLGVKGIGEIGTIGAAAAIANAVYHATGRRVCDLPITLDQLL